MSSFRLSLARFIRELLAPPGDVCLTCGSRTRFDREWPGICRSCVEAIPWILRPRCLHCGRAFGCPDCMRPDARQRSFILNRSAVRYNEMMREWLAQYKYRGHERYAALIIQMLSHAFVRMQHEISALQQSPGRSRKDRLWQPDLVTYVPVSDERLLERGFNQAETLARGIGKIHRIPVVPLLVRTEHTGKQSFKTRQERFDSMKHAFDICPDVLAAFQDPWEGFIRPGRDSASNGCFRILLIDDIYTTGSTINTCADVIRSGMKRIHGSVPEVYSLTWARS